MLVDEADLDISVVSSTSSSSSGVSSNQTNNNPSIPKISKKSISSTDQLASSLSGRPGGTQKPQRRKPGPLPKDFSYKRFR